MAFFRQVYALLRRDLILHIRWWPSTLAQTFVSPFVFLLLLYGLSQAYLARQSSNIAHPSTSVIEPFPICNGRVTTDPKCINFLFTPDNAQSREVLTVFSTKYALQTGTILRFDTLPSANASPPANLGFVAMDDASAINDYILSHQNSSQFALEFNFAPPEVNYVVWYNASLYAAGSELDFFSPPLVSLNAMLHSSILSIFSPNTPNVQISKRAWPTLPTKNPDTLSAALGPSLIFTATMIPIVIALTTIVGEKASGLRRLLEILGCSREAWFFAILLFYSLLTFFVSLVTTCFGWAFGFETFRYCNFGIMLLVLWVHCIAEVSFFFTASAFLRTPSTAVLFASFWFVLGLLFQACVFSSSFIGFVWWSDQINPAGWKVLIFVPWFNFGTLLTSISSLSVGDVNSFTGAYIPPKGFGWKNFYEPIGESSLVDRNTTPPAPNVAMLFLLMNIGLWCLVGWYLDAVLPDDYGMRRSIFFPFTRQYWLSRRFRKDVDVQKWREAHAQDNGDELYQEAVSPEPKGLRVVGLGKKYKKFVALDNISFAASAGELIAILGTNGAGKSTAMKILSGTLHPSQGHALVFDNYTLDDQIKLGLCSQDDLIYPDLTPVEHFRLYSSIRGCPMDIEDKLTTVGLLHRRHDRVGTFSGGMRRRLSVVLSTIGDPDFLILDEVSTGMDPLSKHSVWKFIEAYKPGRVILLVTHSMDEASLLSDRVLLFKKGKIVEWGTSTDLIHRHNQKYKLSIFSSNLSQVPHARLEDQAGSGAVWSVEREFLGEVLDWCVKMRQLGEIEGYEVGTGGLEEVFHSIAGAGENQERHNTTLSDNTNEEKV